MAWERLKHIAGKLYYSYDRGRFLSWAEARPTVEFYRVQGYRATVQASENLLKAADTLTSMYGLEQRQAEERLGDYLNRLRSWVEEGREGDRPEILYL